MAYDRSDHVKLVSERQHEQAREIMPLVRLVSGAAVLMETLTTRDEHWNRYLQYLQGIMERFEQGLASAKAKLEDPSVWKAEDLLKLKGDVVSARSTVEALKLAIQLPSAIMSGHDKAESLIAEFNKREEQKNEPAGQAKS